MRFGKKLILVTHGYIAITWIILLISYLFTPNFHPFIWIVATTFTPFSYLTVFWFIRSLKKDIQKEKKEAAIRKIQRFPYMLTFLLYFFDFFIFVTGIILHKTGVLDILEAMVLAMLVGAYLFFGFENALYELKKEGYYQNLRKIRIPFTLKIITTFFVFIIVPMAFIGFKLYYFTSTGMTILGDAAYLAIMQTVLRTIFISLISGAILGYNIIFPIKVMSENMGLVESSAFEIRTPVFTNDEFGLLSSGFNLMVEGLKEKEKIKNTFGKVVDPVIRDTLLRGNLELGGVSRKGVVLFSDIREFTSLSENLDAADLVKILNDYFEKMGVPIARNSGLINKFIGDAILAIFNIPVKMEHPEKKALLAAVGMIRELHALNREKSWNLRTGIGIHSGRVIAGNIGTPERMEYTVIGDTVNTASRLESITKIYHTPILATEDVISALPDGESTGKDFYFREIDTALLKGKENPVKIYEIFGYEPEELLHQKLEHSGIFSNALEEYKKGNFSQARAAFKEYSGKMKDDPLPDIFIRRCEKLTHRPPGKNWKGVAKILIK